MLRSVLLLGLLAALSACGDGQPLFDVDDGTDVPPPGTGGNSSSEDVTRFERVDGQGGGFVRDVRYDRASDTFFVDNLAFDGDNVYTRDDDVPTLSDAGSPAVYRVFAGDQIVRDPTDNDPVQQFEYRAIYGESSRRTPQGEPVTSFAIVRTGSYVDYGFGGFVYERNGGFDLPTTGQATYAGDYAGIRTFDGRAGLEYTTGEAHIAIDFRDFNRGEGVQGTISNRRAFDTQGNAIPLGTGPGQLQLPDLVFDVGPGTVRANGEMSNGVRSYTVNPDGSLEEYESGTYYAIVAGPNANEIVGIIVVESEDPRYGEDTQTNTPNVTAQETGGFIVYR